MAPLAVSGLPPAGFSGPFEASARLSPVGGVQVGGNQTVQAIDRIRWRWNVWTRTQLHGSPILRWQISAQGSVAAQGKS